MKFRDIVIHLLGWVAFLAIVTFWQWDIFSFYGALVHALRIALISMAIFYSNYYLLLPKLFAKGKLLYYALSIVFVTFSVYFIFHTSRHLMPRPDFANYPRMEMREIPPMEMLEDPMVMRGDRNDFPKMTPPNNQYSQWTRMVPQTAAQTIPILFFSTLLWFANENRLRREKEVALMNENLLSEMRFLKSQINPHFLFNALNNIYSLSFRKSDHTPQMIMKLSDMLRHVVYDSSNRVLLQKEINYIQNYIDFQTLKIGSTDNISFTHSNVDDRLLLEPMLLIPFIENAFKHSNIEDAADGFIEIKLETEMNTIKLVVSNSFSTMTQTKDQTPGIGWQNVQQRLNLAYPGKSSLSKVIGDNVFTVNLEIETNA